MLEMGRKGLLGKALARPDLVRQVIAKAQAEGAAEAYRQTMGRLEAAVPLGYSSAGVVVDVGCGVADLVVGDRVACTGPGTSGHAEATCTPINLCARIPENVSFEQASFAALGGIALEAIRVAHVALGENVAVIGLGLLGQIAVQLLYAAGCHVVGMDPDARKAAMAAEHGADAVASDYAAFAMACRNASKGHGMDAVLIFAATSSNEPLEQAAEACRERGRIVAAGLTGLEVPRKTFYEKELDLVVSRAWGPGLYDPAYAQKGIDYPFAYARWTAKRNMEEFLAQVARGSIKLDHLITHRFPFERAVEAYDLILEGKEPYIGVVLTYGEKPEQAVIGRRIDLPAAQASKTAPSDASGRTVRASLIGAGLFAKGTLLPAMKGVPGLEFSGVASASGLTSRHVGDRFGFRYCTTDYSEVLRDPQTDLVFILTRHGSHAKLAAEAMRAGKHVFVEKPLAISEEQLEEVVAAFAEAPGAGPDGAHPLLMVGFNRRFSPFTAWIKEELAGVTEPVSVHCTVNAGYVPPDSWVHDPEDGAGRIIGEVCHFIDLVQHLTGSFPTRVHSETLDAGAYRPSDNVIVTLKMANGSLGSISYLAGGDKRFRRERVEVIGGGCVGVIENFRAASITKKGRTRTRRNWLSVDRGHRGEIIALVQAIQRRANAPVSFEDYLSTTRTSFAIEVSLRTRAPVELPGSFATASSTGA
jgi:predicted dehydrogenase/threonine dehydrogenase-like Zn-dependent dehydrogenase